MAEEAVATHREVADVKEQLIQLSRKVDKGIDSINLVHNMLSEQRGANIPIRLGELEHKVDSIKQTQDEQIFLPVTVTNHGVKIEELSSFQYKIAGALVVLNTILIIGGHFIVNTIFKAPAP